MLPLTVIICTYEREEAVGKTLASLFGPEVQASHSVDLRVIVVDQGRSLQREIYPDDWNLRIVHQDNFGGAGGFARGMIEAMNEGAGWLLLMDDDATPDIKSFPILADYIRSRAPETRFALHGAMFSSEEPNTIYEAGATIKEPKSRHFDIVQRLRGYEPTAPIQEDPKLWENMDIDYGAWWFFCIHTECIKEVGLPLPLFIRGDDREYGLRLKAVGIPTIPLPGLRIWHPAHEGRLDRWYFLFDFRNKLIAGMLHCPPSALLLPLTVWKKVFYRLLAAEYDLAALMIAGLDCFLQGPASLRSPVQTTPRQARNISSQYVQFADLEQCRGHHATRVTRFRRMRRNLQTLMLNGLFFPSRQGISLPIFDQRQFDWLRVFRLPAFAVVGANGKSARLHHRCRRTFLRLLGHLCRSTFILFLRYKHLRCMWQSGARELVTAEAWKRHTFAYSNTI